ncbi:MAG: phosphoglycerate dehydrogenase [Candidatus Cloacimonetes bacterium]|nr:phosphoglycerate dehydrogenase [Candidatus Cloacimonadota bacterium]
MNSILCTTSSFGIFAAHVFDILKEKGFQTITNPYNRKITEDELIELLDQYHPIGLLAGTEPITRAVLEQSKDYLKIISRVGVGWDNVDRKTAGELGILVYRTEGILNQAVAELTLGFILSSLRNIVHQDKEIRRGIWKKKMGGLLTGKTVGIIGFGSIGERVGELLNAFGSNVIFFDPAPKKCPWAESVSIHELLKKADVITLHTSGTNRILGEKEIYNLCKKGVIIVNMARGGLIDEEALYKALQDGHVSYACLDVFENEPYNGHLIEIENVILTPHIGSYAREARIQMEEMAVENLFRGMAVLS